MRTKYDKGVRTHGGHLWENSIERILDFAIEEAIDNVVYLYTIRHKLREIGERLDAIK